MLKTLDHNIGLAKIIKKGVSNQLNYHQLLISCYGADPRDIWNIYKNYKQEVVKKNWLRQYKNYPEPHPAYSQWRIDKKSESLIFKKLNNKHYSSICFLSCPVLGMRFAQKNKSKITILDIDSDVIKKSKKYATSVIYDLKNPIPKNLINKFNCVVCDPPWYSDDINLILARASDLVVLGGSIYFSLPRILTRPKLIEDRLIWQKKMSDWGLLIVEIYPEINYEVPAFEYCAYQDIPAFSGAVWRIGDWVKVKKVVTCCKKNIKIKPNNNEWLIFSAGSKRIFLKNKKLTGYQPPQIISLIDNDVLKSVSKRNPLIKKIDIWTSRNEVFKIKTGWLAIKIILENIHLSDDKILKKISNQTNQPLNKINTQCLSVIKKIKTLY